MKGYRMKARVRSKEYIEKWLEDNGYKLNSFGWEVPTGKIGFTKDMFDYCDKVIDVEDYESETYDYFGEEWTWLKEWLIFEERLGMKENDTGIYNLAPNWNINENDIKPNHYKEFGIEVKEIIKFVLEHADNSFTPYEAFCVGNELKYRLRAGFKGEEKMLVDMNKAMEYYKYREEK